MGAQLVQQTDVGGWKLVLTNLLPRDPGQSQAINWLGFMAPPAAKEEFQVDGPFGIIVRERFHQFSHLRLDAQFLGQFAVKALFECFARFAFSSRKFP